MKTSVMTHAILLAENAVIHTNNAMAISIHDNIVYEYTVSENKDAQNTYHITIYSEYRSKETIEYTDIMFRTVLAHYFLGTLPGSILFAIEQQNIQDNINQYKDLFLRTRSYGWPPIRQEIAELATWLIQEQYMCFGITTSYGLVEGWIWAKHMEIHPRAERKACTH